MSHADLDRNASLDQALGRPAGFFREAVELWDSTFRLPFFEVRQALKDITMDSFAAVTGARVLTASSVDRWPPADVVLFSDDDDWFAPHVGERLARFAGKAHGVTWTSVTYTGELARREPGFCYTNNYAVMAEAPLPGPWTERVLVHGKADVTFRRPGFRTKTLADPLSASNKHPASALRIRDALAARPGREGLIAEVEAFTRRAAAAPEPTGDLSWTAGPVARTVELFARVRPR